MPVKTPMTGRKSAYFARNRALIIRSTQELLGSSSKEFTIEDVALRAEMALSTIYKHFDSREALIQESVVAAMTEWENWATEKSKELETPLEKLVAPMLLFISMPSTHPLYAKLAVNTKPALDLLRPKITANLRLHIKRLVKAQVLEIDTVEDRIANLVACIESAFTQAVQKRDSSARNQIRLALGQIGIDERTASKLVTDISNSLRKTKR